MKLLINILSKKLKSCKTFFIEILKFIGIFIQILLISELSDMESDKIQGSDSEEEMTSKSEYIAALRMVHQLDGKFISGHTNVGDKIKKMGPPPKYHPSTTSI